MFSMIAISKCKIFVMPKVAPKATYQTGVPCHFMLREVSDPYPVHRARGYLDRLTIQKIHSLIDLPVWHGVHRKQKTQESSDGSTEVRNICWQEKLFSQYELDYYGLKENCELEYQKKYYNRLKIRTHQSGILFTYVEQDNIYPSGSNSHNYAASISQKYLQSMYLMADLDQDVLLFSIHWFPESSLMIVRPDFNSLNVNPYYYETQGANLQMYHYTLEKCNTLEKQLFESLNTTKIARNISMFPFHFDSQNHYEQRNQLSGHLLFLLEIVTAKALGFDAINVRYQIKVHEQIRLVEGSDQLSGSTSSSKNRNGHWSFGHCHELLLVLPEFAIHSSYVEIYFEVIAIDSLQRERRLGQTYLSIPSRPQKKEVSTHVLQLTHSNAIFDHLETFLVGNNRKIDCKSFFGKSDTTILNRYGNKSDTSGELQVRYQFTRQCQINALNHRFFNEVSKLRRIVLDDLIATYSAARERLEELIELQY